MIDRNRIPENLLPLLEAKLQGQGDGITIPPPAFDIMKGEFLSCDIESATLTIRFPVLAEQLNPYGTMQGGFIAAAIDNTIGPLSMLVAPPNFTRSMEVTYSQVVSPGLGFIHVTAKFIEQMNRKLTFEAIVETVNGSKLATAKSVHLIVNRDN